MGEREQLDKPLRDLIETIHFTENVAAKIHGLLDEDDIYRAVKEEFAKSKRYNVSILLLTEDGLRLRVETTILSPEKLKAGEKATGLRLKEYKIDLKKSSILSQVVKEGKTIQATVYDVIGELFPRPLVKLITKIVGYERAKNILTPLKRHGKVIGILSMSSSELAEHFIPSVRSLAQHISTALELAHENAIHKRTEEALRKSEERYRMQFEEALDPIFIADAETGIMIDCNRAASELIGRKKSELVGKHQRMLHPPEEIEGEFSRTFRQHLKEKEGQVLETKVITQKGEIKDVAIKANIFELEGKKMILGIFRDITERKTAEERIRASEEKYRNLFDNARDVILTMDLKGNVTSISKAVEEYGFKKDEMVGKNMLKFVSKKDWPKLLKELAILAQGNPVEGEIELNTPKGRKISGYRSNPIIQGKKVVGFQTIMRDVTERKRMEEELRRHSEHLEVLVEERTKKLREAERMAAIGETAAMVGHDLRNPLQVITGMLYLVNEKLNSAPIKDRKIIEKYGLLDMRGALLYQVGYMDKILTELQDFARPLKPRLEPTDMRKLIEDVFSTMTIPQNVQVSRLIKKDFPKLTVDPALMKRVFTNLVANAGHAMPDGGKITIRASKTDEDASISVEDTGIGIPKEKMNGLFEPLPTTKPGATGLGLVICRRLVETHGGSITAESKVGKGSTFTVKLPFREEVS